MKRRSPIAGLGILAGCLLACSDGGAAAATPPEGKTVKDAKSTVVLGEPVAVSQAPASVKEWGPWQFPELERLADGRIHLSYHIEADSATAYGKPFGHAYSKDDGRTWTPAKEPDGDGGLLLPNGDRLRPAPQRSIPASSLKLPKPLFARTGSWGGDYRFYTPDQLGEVARGYRLERLPAGGKAWSQELPTVKLPDPLRYVTEGVLPFPSLAHGFAHWRPAPDGSTWIVTYQFRRTAAADRAKLGEVRFGAIFLRSTDNGHTWDTVSEIPYQPDPAADPNWAKRDGFTEPDFCFLPDGSLFCLMRTQDGTGQGALLSARSTDGGRTWSRPAVFDDLGVMPKLLVLKNGTTLAAYGRPGLYVRASADPAGKEWRPRVEIVKGDATCSYCDLLPLGPDRALIAYSDFKWPDQTGAKRKTILVRTITVKGP
ncbi:MAG TPA: sialidase family protein [Planctomycetota bacterium]|nr:sialidase family protein [Planctomycetota bacterium]